MSKTKKGNATRCRIVAAARKKLVRHGVEQFVMRDLADSLQMKLGNLQYYFNTREQLLLHLFRTEAARDLAVIGAHEKKNNAPEVVFRAIVKDLVVRWRGDGGVVFSTLGTLAQHNAMYRKLYRDIYRDFYAALTGPIRQLNPKLSDDEVLLRVRLVTALVDGSPMQIQVGDTQAYLAAVQAEAELIACR
ncbi:MAG: TetR family transcriptional regulator [Pseudomonadota bacterium]